MRKRHFLLLLVLNFVPCLCYGVQVTQEQKLLIVQTGKTVNLHCQQNDSSYHKMFWYQQKPGEGLELMVYSVDEASGDMEEKFKARWSLNRTHLLNSTLCLTSAESQDAAVYFCAVSKHSHRYKSSGELKTCSSALLIGTVTWGESQGTVHPCYTFRGSYYCTRGNVILYSIV